jgi:hypothetical protein
MLRGMTQGNMNALSRSRMSVFAAACWFLALMAFVQLLVAGMALATRLEESRVVRVIEKEVPKPVVIRVPAPGPANAAVVSRPPAPVPAEVSETLPPPSPLATPRIADAKSERLVNEARAARVAGDMGRAIIKLQDALGQSPDDANVHYEVGMVHEQMGVYDTAAAHYEKVFQMGIAGAGALYQMAGAKLRDGFEQPGDMVGKLSLGRVRIFPPPGTGDGRNVILTIPVQKAPAEEVDVGEIAVSVVFFNRSTKGEITQLEDKSWVSEQWVTLPFDWAGGEENLRMTYSIPAQDEQTEHLFGDRRYHGQVVTLTYKGEVLDVQAWPRDLAARLPGQAAPGGGPDQMLPEFQNELPLDFDPDLGVLPPPLPE